jgi:CheY-like chemotaxis protein
MAQSNLIYIIDDAPDYRHLVQTIFTRFLPAYEIRVFESGNTLMHHVLRTGERPGLILLDRHMPGRDGHQTLQMLKQHPDWQTIPVAMFSSHASWEEMEACYRSGANSFLKKPLGLAPLKQLLETTCHYWIEMNQSVSVLHGLNIQA